MELHKIIFHSNQSIYITTAYLFDLQLSTFNRLSRKSVTQLLRNKEYSQFQEVYRRVIHLFLSRFGSYMAIFIFNKKGNLKREEDFHNLQTLTSKSLMACIKAKLGFKDLKIKDFIDLRKHKQVQASAHRRIYTHFY